MGRSQSESFLWSPLVQTRYCAEPKDAIDLEVTALQRPKSFETFASLTLYLPVGFTCAKMICLFMPHTHTFLYHTSSTYSTAKIHEEDYRRETQTNVPMLGPEILAVFANSQIFQDHQPTKLSRISTKTFLAGIHSPNKEVPTTPRETEQDRLIRRLEGNNNNNNYNINKSNKHYDHAAHNEHNVDHDDVDDDDDDDGGQHAQPHHPLRPSRKSSSGSGGAHVGHVNGSIAGHHKVKFYLD